MNVLDWEIEKRHKECDGCGKSFNDGDICHTVFKLSEDEEAGERFDICSLCWENGRHGPSREERGKSILYWKGIVKIRIPEKKEEVIKKSSIERLLKKFMRSADPMKINVSYILALILERKKFFLVIDNIVEKGTGKKLIVYEHAKTGENFVIQDPEVTSDKITEVQEHVRELLDNI